MSKSIKIGSKWSGKTAASALGTVGIFNNSDDTVLLTNTKGTYKVKEILSKEDFKELIANEQPGKKAMGKNRTNRNIARALQEQYNKQSNKLPKSHSRGTKKAIVARSPSPKGVATRSPSPKGVATRSPSPVAAKSPSLTTTRRKPKVAPTPSITPRRKPKVAPTSSKRETSLERDLRLVAESQPPANISVVTSLHNNDMSKVVAKMTVPELKDALSTRGLSIKGLKKELVNRLINAIKENAH